MTEKTVFNITASSDVLLRNLEKVYSAAAKKDITPILQCVLLESRFGFSDRLYFMGSDVCSVVTSTSDISILQEGRVALPAKRFLEIMRAVAKSEKLVNIKATERSADIVVGDVVWTLALQSESAYPKLPVLFDDKIDPYYALDSRAFAKAIEAVRYAAKDTTVPALMAVDVSGNKVTACDGVRFQQVKLFQRVTDFNFQIPTSALDELLKLLLTPGDTVARVVVLDKKLMFKKDGTFLIVQKWTVRFPDVETLLLRPALENRYKLQVSKKQLIEAIKRVRINSDPETNAIELSFSKNFVLVRAWDRTGNFAVEPVDAQWAHGEWNVVVHQQYLLDMLSAHSGEVCNFRLGGKGRKTAILLEDSEHGTIGVTHQMLDLATHPKAFS